MRTVFPKKICINTLHIDQSFSERLYFHWEVPNKLRILTSPEKAEGGPPTTWTDTQESAASFSRPMESRPPVAKDTAACEPHKVMLSCSSICLLASAEQTGGHLANI